MSNARLSTTAKIYHHVAPTMHGDDMALLMRMLEADGGDSRSHRQERGVPSAVR